jgi:hypothetical protein
MPVNGYSDEKHLISAFQNCKLARERWIFQVFCASENARPKIHTDRGHPVQPKSNAPTDHLTPPRIPVTSIT